MPHRLYPTVAVRADHRCEHCAAPEVIAADRFQVEHIVPRSRGGSDELPNLALSCPPCNRRKARAMHGLDPETRTTAALFHPRRDSWDDHFLTTILEHGITIDGRTS